MLGMCVYAAQPQSVFVWPSTGNSTTQLTDIMLAQLHRWSPSLSQEFVLILAQRILLTLENDQPHGQVRPQKKIKTKLYFTNLLTGTARQHGIIVGNALQKNNADGCENEERCFCVTTIFSIFIHF